MSLVGKCAVVYSGARGIGKSYCEHLLQNGCKVYFGDILVEEGSQTAKELGSKYKGSTITFLKCNVLVDTEVKELLVRAITECDRVDIVIANTGIIDETNWEKCIQTNLGSVIRIFYTTLEHMSKSNGGKGGDFIVTSSRNGLRPNSEIPVYTATKHAITGFVRAWGTEFNYRLTNIRINCICPIGVRTKLMLDIKPEQLLLKEHNQLADEWKDITFQLLSPDDVGESLIALLLDTEANGQCLRINKDGRYYAKFLEEAV